MTKMALGTHPFLLGFEQLERLVERTAKSGNDGYPPYNIESTGEDQYQITLAVAGFGADEIEIETRDNLLKVVGKKGADVADRNYLYRGIANRNFERSYQLADYVRVDGAELKDGLLHVNLVREVPEAMKPRRIEIRGQDDKLIESEVQAA